MSVGRLTHGPGGKVTVLDGSLQELASVDSSTLAGFASDGEISIDLALEADQPVIVRVSDSDDPGAIHSDVDYAVALMTRPQSSDDQGYGVLTSGVDFHGSFSSLSPETLVLELAAGEAGDQSTFSLGAGSPGVTLRIYDQSGSVLTEAGTNAQIDGYSLSAGESIDFNTSSAAQTVLVELTPSSTGAYVANLSGAGDRMVYSRAAGLGQRLDGRRALPDGRCRPNPGLGGLVGRHLRRRR